MRFIEILALTAPLTFKRVIINVESILTIKDDEDEYGSEITLLSGVKVLTTERPHDVVMKIRG